MNITVAVCVPEHDIFIEDVKRFLAFRYHYECLVRVVISKLTYSIVVLLGLLFVVGVSDHRHRRFDPSESIEIPVQVRVMEVVIEKP